VTDDSQQVHRLFSELRDTYIRYTDSLSHASDSASIARAITSLDEALVKVYAKYPPNLDTRLSPSQNDTLWSLTQAYARLRAPLTHRAATDSVPSDTLSADSIPNRHS